MSEVVVVGSINVDLSIPVAHAPNRGETMLGGDLTRGPGGKGANQAAGCARLGRSVTMIGAVGDDPEGAWMVDLLSAEGIDTSYIRTLEAATGQAVILVEPDGESTIVVAPGANAALSVGDIHAVRDVISGARCVLVQQEIDAAVVREVARIARGLFVLNPAPSRPLAPEVLDRVDVLVPNRFELADLCGRPAAGSLDEIAAMAGSLEGPSAVVVTLGSNGALVVENGEHFHVPQRDVVAVDATAAGDTFCAALVDGLLDGLTTLEAARRANLSAAYTVERPGALSSMPFREDLTL
jgi:ribokinase